MSPHKTTSSESLECLARAKCMLTLTCADLAAVVGGWAYYREDIPEHVFPYRLHLEGIRSAGTACGRFRVLASNPRYFTDDSRRAAVLASTHIHGTDSPKVVPTQRRP